MPASLPLALPVLFGLALAPPDAGAAVPTPALTTGAEALPADLLGALRAGVDGLGTYRLRFTKEERMASGWVGPQVMELVVREAPFAVSARVVAGPNTGRRFLYDVTKRKRELRVREAGVLGIAALWLDIDSKLTRDDTDHAVTELGYGFVLRQIERDAQRAKGAHTRVDEPAVAGRAACSVITAPAGVPGLYAQKTRLCVDRVTGLITRVEVWDEHGLAERFAFEVLARNLEKQPGAAKLFDLDANGL